MAKVISNLVDNYNNQDNDPRMNNQLHNIVGWLALSAVLYLIFS